MQERENWVLTSYLLQDSPLSFFCPTSCSSQESKGFFANELHTRAVEVQEAKEAVESARTGWSPQKGDVRKKRKEKKDQGRWSVATRRGTWEKKKRKEKDQGRQEGGSCKGKVPFALHQEILFLIHEYFGLEEARLGWSIGSYETWSTRKPCAKEVPETDYFMQQKQYL